MLSRRKIIQVVAVLGFGVALLLGVAVPASPAPTTR